jgi:hypothetical protein
MEDNHVYAFTEGWPIDREGMLDAPGEYILSVVISGDSAATLPPYRVKLIITEDWKTAEMEPIT